MLVIIGLIVGGVLVGQNLIFASEIRAAVTQLEKYNTAANTFKGKYNALPGDMINATSYFPADSNCSSGFGSQTRTATCNGNGNGTIEFVGLAPYSSNNHEQYLVFQHLALANLIGEAHVGSGVYSLSPDPLPTLAGTNTVGNLCVIFNDGSVEPYMATNPVWSMRGVHIFNIAVYPCLSSGGGGQQLAISPARAYGLDAKMDDGKPLTGTILAPDYLGTTPACMTTGSISTAAYLTSNTVNIGASPYAGAIGCILFLKAQF